MTDEQRAAVDGVAAQIDAAVGGIWARIGRRHGFLLGASGGVETIVSALAIALRRYDLPEILAVVTWSARQVAAGQLDPRLFATTFRGAGFDARHRSHAAATAPRAGPAPPPEQTGPSMAAADLGEAAAAAVARFTGEPGGALLTLERLAGWRQ